MRVFLVGVMVALVGCGEPCRSSTSELEGRSSTFACVADDAGVRVVPRAYSSLSENTATACAGALDGGQLAFSLTNRSCEAGASEAPVLVTCTLPALPAGRYAVGERTLIVSADAGVLACD